MIINNTSEKLSAGNADLSGSTFTNVRLFQAVFNDVNLAESVFDDINLTGAKFTNANLSNTEVTDSDTTGMKIDGILVEDLRSAYEKYSESQKAEGSGG